MSFIVVFGKESQELVRNSGSTVGELKAEIEGMLQMPSAMQKLMCSGKMLKDDGQTLAQVRGIRERGCGEGSHAER